MIDDLSRARLAALAGLSEADVAELETLGLIAPGPAGFTPGDLLRVRLVAALEETGIDRGALGRAVGAGALSLGFGASALPEPVMLSGETVGEALAALALPEDFARRLWLAAGFPGFDGGTALREDDRELLGLVAQARAIGVSEESLVRAVRVFGHALRRIANVMRDLFRAEAEERPGEAGLAAADRLAIGAERQAALQTLGFRSVFLLQRRFLEQAIFANMATRVQEILLDSGLMPAPAASAPTVAFVDLSGFTRFAEATGDAAAADRAAELEAMAQEAAVQRGGRLVKSLGDGVMLFFERAPAAIDACLDILDRVARRGDVGARAGLATGPVVHRDGDVFGTTVNLAARLADHAGPGTVLVSSATRAACGAGYAIDGPRTAMLKGLGEVPVFQVGAALGR